MPTERRLTPRFVAIGLVLAVVVGVVASSAGAGRADSSRTHAAASLHGKAGGSSLTVDMGQGITTLDPAVGASLWEVGLIGNFYARLTQFGTKPGPHGTTQYDPAHTKLWLAKSLRISRNHLVYTFHLRPGLKFPSGHRVNSAAVKYTFHRIAAMNSTGVAYAFDDRTSPPQIKSIGTPNATTVVIRLNKPDPNALQNWAQPSAGIVDPSVVNAHGGVKKNSINKWMSSHVAGYGPYLLKSYVPNKDMVLTANPGFFQKPATRQITVNFINDDSTNLLRAEGGKADVTLFLSKQAAHSLARKTCCRLILNPVAEYEMIVLPNTVVPFKSKLFRKGLAYAVPYQQILNSIAYGYGQLYYGPWSPAMPYFNRSIEKPIPYNLAKAKQLVKASGVKTPVNIPLDVPAGDATAQQIATAVKSIWQQLGVNVTIQTLSPSAYSQEIDITRKYAAIKYDGPGVIAPDYQWAWDDRCGAAYNASRICVPAADKLIMGKLYKVFNPKKRQQIVNKATRLWVADYPRIPLFGDVNVTVLSSRVTHYYFSPETDMRTWAVK